MGHGKLTREQAIERAGLGVVEKVEGLNCGFTNRVDQSLDLEGVYEFAASVDMVDKDGIKRTLTVYYYPDKSQVDNCEGDLGSVDWDCIEGYDID